MNVEFNPVPGAMGCMGCYMGYTDPNTGLWYPDEADVSMLPPANGSSGSSTRGLTPQGASVITGIVSGLTDITTGLLSLFGPQAATPTPVAIPGYPVVNVAAPRSAGMDPMMLAAIGIPAVLIGVALMGKKR
jgi:hypothetical protein